VDAVIKSFLIGITAVAGHFGVTVVLLGVGAALYARLTPQREIILIRDGNMAAALSFGGAVVCLAIPLAASLAASRVLAEVAVWGAFALVGQLVAFFIVDRLFHHLPRRIANGEVAAAVFLVAIKLAVALIGAASLTS
jgi:putative membrane protein